MTNIKWNPVTEKEHIDKILQESQQENQLIFKHSNSCGISNIVKQRLEKEAKDAPQFTNIHLIDVIKQRSLSADLATQINVQHESPQILVISKGQCIFHTSHFDVSLKNIPVHTEQ